MISTEAVRESAVEKYLHSQVTAQGGTTRKWKSPGRPHVPDRIVIWPVLGFAPGTVEARIHFIEVKAPGKKPRPGQQREHKRLDDLGCTVLVLDTKEKIDDYIARWK